MTWCSKTEKDQKSLVNCVAFLTAQVSLFVSTLIFENKKFGIVHIFAWKIK